MKNCRKQVKINKEGSLMTELMLATLSSHFHATFISSQYTVAENSDIYFLDMESKGTRKNNFYHNIKKTNDTI